MGRLTQKEASGKWQVKGISWEELQEGKAVTEEMRRRLYGCLCKLKDYEDTGMSPQQMENRMNGMTLLLSKEGNAREYDDTYDIVIHCGSEEEQKKCRKMLKGMQWNPADESPEGEGYVLLSFENFSIPLVGRYEEYEDGGAYYMGDDEESCVSQDMIVNAWKRLPEPYRAGD